MTREQKIRDTLAYRLAGIYDELELGTQHCFSGLFNGARGDCWITPPGRLFAGKAECEWEWEKTWGELRDRGLLTWTEKDIPNHPKFGGSTRHIYPVITDLGERVREDELAYFRDLMDAMTDDRAEARKIGWVR